MATSENARPAQQSLDIASLRARYRSGELTVRQLVDELLERIAARENSHIWIALTPAEELFARAAKLDRLAPQDQPLYGIPFAIKDNMDCQGMPTTAGCPDFAYVPDRNAVVVQKLLDAGALLIGKTNLDQFATGLVGVRSPYGACENAINPDYISGGSSSGSAVAVAAGLVSFALGTDTAGSGRVPAAFNNIIGLKPTRGLLSTSGVVPACRSLDCVSIFVLTSADAATVLASARGYDSADPFSRAAADTVDVRPTTLADTQRLAVPRSAQLEFFGDDGAQTQFEQLCNSLAAQGHQLIEIDFEPFLQTARLLYDGPWVAERYAAIETFIQSKPDALHPTTRQIIEGGKRYSAVAAYQAYYQLKTLRQTLSPLWQTIDALLTPTAGTIYTIAEVEADPVRLNSHLGYYTNFMNLLDLCAVAVPAGRLANGLPFGVTVTAPAWHERRLLTLADRLHRLTGLTLGATEHALPAWPYPITAPADRVLLAVNGAHMSGLPLNHELSSRGAEWVGKTQTSPDYRLYALDGFDPPRPGLIRRPPGKAIEVEVWSVPTAEFGSFVNGIPAPLGIGTVTLADGSMVRGFLCEPYVLEAATDISDLGGWRAYLETLG